MGTISFSPVTSIMENKPAGTVITGSPGKGKTYFMLNLFSNALMMNQIVIGIDPKNDFTILKKKFPFIRITDVNKIAPGSLDPFRVFKDIDSVTLLSIIECMTGGLTQRQLLAITPIVEDFVVFYAKDEDSRNFMALTNYLYANKSEASQEVGNMLRMHMSSKYGPLIFAKYHGNGDGEYEDLNINGHSQIISLLGMPLPKVGKKLKIEQKFTSAIVFIICKILSNILATKSKIPRILFMDESHIAMANEAFQDIIDEILVLGRSLNVCTVLASQNISHIPEEFDTQIANKFSFAMSVKECKEFFKRYSTTEESGSDLDEIIVTAKMSKQGQGEAYFIDNENRSGFIKIKSGLDLTSNPLFREEIVY